MKFTVTKELRHNAPLRQLIMILLLGIGLFLVLDMFNHFVQLGFNISDIRATILGDEEAFVEPLPLSSLLQIIHMDLFFSVIVLFLLAIVYVRVGKNDSVKTIMIHTLFLSSILSHVALFFIAKVGVIMIAIWLGLFWFWHILAMVMIGVSMWGLFGRG